MSEIGKKVGKITNKQRSIGAFVLLAILCVLIYFLLGLFVIQPIGAYPDGQIIVFTRNGTGLPFLSSADGLLLDAGENVSLLGRGVILAAVANKIEDRILTRLPYIKSLYLLTTDGKEFSN